MAEKYDTALNTFAASNGEKQREAGAMVKGQDRAPTDLVDQLVELFAKRNAEDVRAIHQESEWLAWVILAMLGPLVAGSIAVTRKANAVLKRSVRKIRTGADQVTRGRHPGI